MSAYEHCERQVDIFRHLEQDGVSEQYWRTLEAKVNSTEHRSLDSLKLAIKREWKKLCIDDMCFAIGCWSQRLRACVKARGGRF